MKALCTETVLAPNRESWYDKGSLYEIQPHGNDYKIKDNNGDWHYYNKINFNRYFELQQKQ